MRLPVHDVEQLAFVEIRDRRSRELVTVIEVLSPFNKRPGSSRDQYLAKRQELLDSTANLVEIDLLRAGNPMPLEERPENSLAYSVLVSRVDHRPKAGFWPIGLRDRLPIIPVPLRTPRATPGSTFKRRSITSTMCPATKTICILARRIRL